MKENKCPSCRAGIPRNKAGKHYYSGSVKRNGSLIRYTRFEGCQNT